MIELENGEVVRAAEHAAQIVERRGSTQYAGPDKIVSLRVPADLFLDLQALTNVSGKTKNAMINTLLEVGIEEVKALLQPETLHDLSAIHAELSREFYSEVQ